MRIGAHVSTAGGVDRAVDRALEMGCECLQFFVSSPQGWAYKPLDPEAAARFRERRARAGLGPAVLHAPYLINLGASDPEHLRRSVDLLAFYLTAAAQLGAMGVVFHSGSHKGVGFEAVLPQAVSAMREALARSPEEAWLIIENTAGMGNHIAARFEEIARMMEGVASPRVKVCLDTQHLFAAGYPVTDPEGLDRTLREFDRLIGLPQLVVVHANDSQPPFASGVDRHANIGEGHIGEEGFAVMLAHPAFREVPFILEVPGADGKGPDKPNVDRLKAIRARVGVGV